MDDGPAFDLQAYSLPLSLWCLVKQHVPGHEQNEVKNMLGDSLVEQSIELHEEVETLLDIWRDYRDEGTHESPRFLPEPPQMRDRLTQEIRFFVENIREKARNQGRDPNQLLSRHNTDVIDYALEGHSRPGSSCLSSRPGTACSILDGRMTPMRATPPSDKVSANSTLSEDIDDMSDKLNMLEFDEVTAHLRETLEEEISQLLKDIVFLQGCLEEESDFQNTRNLPTSREPTLTDLKVERSKLEKEMFAGDVIPSPKSSPARNVPHFNRNLPVVKPSSPKQRGGLVASRRGPVKASHSLATDTHPASHSAKQGQNSANAQHSINNSPTQSKLVKVATITAPNDRSQLTMTPMSPQSVTSQHAPSPPSSAKPRNRPTSATKFRRMVASCRDVDPT